MPEIIDIISPEFANLMSFTVDTSGVDSVTLAVGAGTPYAGNRNGKFIFNRGDSFRLISCGIVIPESFTFFRDAALGTPLPLIDVRPVGVTTGQSYSNPNFTGGGQYVPMENYETVTDVYFNCREAINTIDPTKTLLYENFRLQVYFSVALKISMAGVPATLNGKVYRVSPFLKVSHTISMA